MTASHVRWDAAIKPPRMVGRVVAVTPGAVDAMTWDSVVRAWWRGERLTRVVLRKLGARKVVSVSTAFPPPSTVPLLVIAAEVGT